MKKDSFRFKLNNKHNQGQQILKMLDIALLLASKNLKNKFLMKKQFV